MRLSLLKARIIKSVATLALLRMCLARSTSRFALCDLPFNRPVRASLQTCDNIPHSRRRSQVRTKCIHPGKLSHFPAGMYVQWFFRRRILCDAHIPTLRSIYRRGTSTLALRVGPSRSSFCGLHPATVHLLRGDRRSTRHKDTAVTTTKGMFGICNSHIHQTQAYNIFLDRSWLGFLHGTAPRHYKARSRRPLSCGGRLSLAFCFRPPLDVKSITQNMPPLLVKFPRAAGPAR